MQSTSYKTAGWMNLKTQSRLPRGMPIPSDVQTTPPLWQKEELKSLLMKARESEKDGFKAQHSENEDHGIRSYHFMANRWGNNGNSDRLYFGGLQKSLQIVTAAMKLKDTCFLEEKL